MNFEPAALPRDEIVPHMDTATTWADHALTAIDEIAALMTHPNGKGPRKNFWWTGKAPFPHLVSHHYLLAHFLGHEIKDEEERTRTYKHYRVCFEIAYAFAIEDLFLSVLLTPPEKRRVFGSKLGFLEAYDLDPFQEVDEA